MREAHPIEQAVGMEFYVSDGDGIGGHLRESPEDFRVRELEAFDWHPLEADPGDFHHLVLRATLRGWDTNDFASRLSDALGISRERVSWAGTKDKHAVTTQLFTVKGADPEALPDVSGVEMELLGRAGRGLTFGDLAGNAFGIVVRGPEAPEHLDAITADLRQFAGDGPASDPGDTVTTLAGAVTADDAVAAAEAETGSDADLVRIGVPNYFGQQRFGSQRPVTHRVGLAVLRGDWREAVRRYVGDPAETEPEGTQEARAVADEQFAAAQPDWQTALDAMPGRLRYERSMLHRLAETNAGRDDETAPPASADADDPFRYALEAVPSNLTRLFVNAAQSFVFNRILSERLRRGLPFDRPVAGDVVCFADREAPAGLPLPDTDREQRVTDERVDTVTRHCERGRAYVTAPLVGTDTELADGEPGAIEREILADLDLAPADFDLPGDFRSRGTRRAVLCRTDLLVTRDPVRFEFALPHGSYATAVLREYLKSGPLSL
ncbi:tRNA pseudouridine(13) synthase TruD [Salinirubrum litoreum]|uniref:Probable tRNA pseudouridine synthase D n=1 Tax=Salinirubrum litoreum TaxID=1126234 RepID=A0ABD5R6V1_9EURY|nr:tRNA pseudouridine(13) synthase TruD [Salinirubrum litoreum]